MKVAATTAGPVSRPRAMVQVAWPELVAVTVSPPEQASPLRLNRKVTLPAGVPDPGRLAVTWAVNVTAAALRTGLPD
jgi:hypothetical protein